MRLAGMIDRCDSRLRWFHLSLDRVLRDRAPGLIVLSATEPRLHVQFC